MVVVFVPFFTILIIGLLRPSRSMSSVAGVQRCSTTDHFLLVLQIVVLVTLAIVNIFLLKKEYRKKISNGYQFVKGDIVWNTHLIVKFIIFACFAGFISGAIGLSGGILFTTLCFNKSWIFKSKWRYLLKTVVFEFPEVLITVSFFLYIELNLSYLPIVSGR
jgi:hypothetical protein